MSRRVAREELFKLVFESELKNENVNEIFEDYLKRDEILKNVNELSFIKKYTQGISKHSETIIKTIDSNITGWTFERVGTVEKTLLKIAVYELLYENTPHEIVINEAIELGKLYGDDKTSEFINGVLAKIVNK